MEQIKTFSEWEQIYKCQICGSHEHRGTPLTKSTHLCHLAVAASTTFRYLQQLTATGFNALWFDEPVTTKCYIIFRVHFPCLFLVPTVVCCRPVVQAFVCDVVDFSVSSARCFAGDRVSSTKDCR